jgi:hypothetical protein
MPSTAVFSDALNHVSMIAGIRKQSARKAHLPPTTPPTSRGCSTGRPPSDPASLFPETALLRAQAVRLTALGILAEGPLPYANLAREVADFTGHILGQSLDLMGASLELPSCCAIRG